MSRYIQTVHGDFQDSEMIDKDYASDESDDYELKYKRMLKQTTAMEIFLKYLFLIHTHY